MIQNGVYPSYHNLFFRTLCAKLKEILVERHLQHTRKLLGWSLYMTSAFKFCIDFSIVCVGGAEYTHCVNHIVCPITSLAQKIEQKILESVSE